MLPPLLISCWLVSQVLAVSSRLSPQQKVLQKQLDQLKITEEKLMLKIKSVYSYCCIFLNHSNFVFLDNTKTSHISLCKQILKAQHTRNCL